MQTVMRWSVQIYIFQVYLSGGSGMNKKHPEKCSLGIWSWMLANRLKASLLLAWFLMPPLLFSLKTLSSDFLNWAQVSLPPWTFQALLTVLALIYLTFRFWLSLLGFVSAEKAPVSMMTAVIDIDIKAWVRWVGGIFIFCPLGLFYGCVLRQ